MLNSNNLPIINSYEDLINFNNSIPALTMSYNIEQVSYTKNTIIVNGKTKGLDEFLQYYVLHPHKLTGKVSRLKQYDYTKLLCLLHPNAFYEEIQAYANNIMLMGETGFKLWDFHIEVESDNLVLAWFDNKDAEEIFIPFFITKIAHAAFNIDPVTKTITCMGSFGENLNNLRRIVIQDGSKLKSIGDNAFLGLRTLREINLPDSLAYIGQWAFRRTSLEKVIIPVNVKELKDGTFLECNKLKSIDLKNVESIGGWAFRFCTSLKEVNLPDSLIHIGNLAFADTGVETILFPSNLKEIGESAFYSCENLKSIAFNKKLSKIGAGAFKDCKNLKELNLPSSLRRIGQVAFSHCNSLKSIIIPDTTKTIGKGAFSYCEELHDITIGKGIKVIAADTFYMCKELKEVTILGDVERIGAHAFAHSIIEELVLPRSAEEWFLNLDLARTIKVGDEKKYVQVARDTIAPANNVLKSVKFK